MNIGSVNYLFFGKAKQLLFYAKADKNTINKLLEGIKNMNLSIAEEEDALINGRVPKELIEGTRERIRHLRATRDLLYKRIEFLQGEMPIIKIKQTPTRGTVSEPEVAKSDNNDSSKNTVLNSENIKKIQKPVISAPKKALPETEISPRIPKQRNISNYSYSYYPLIFSD